MQVRFRFDPWFSDFTLSAQRAVEDKKSFHRVKEPATDSWDAGESDYSPRISPRTATIRPSSPERAPVSPRVKKILSKSIHANDIPLQSPRSPRYNYKAEALNDSWTPTSIHGGFSKNDSWAYVRD